MPKNQYLYDVNNKKIKRCGRNVAKMKIVEHMWYNLTQWGFIKHLFEEIIISFLDFLKVLIELLISILNLVFFPITLFNDAREDIKYAKYLLKLHETTMKGEQK